MNWRHVGPEMPGCTTRPMAHPRPLCAPRGPSISTTYWAGARAPDRGTVRAGIQPRGWHGDEPQADGRNRVGL